MKKLEYYPKLSEVNLISLDSNNIYNNLEKHSRTSDPYLYGLEEKDTWFVGAHVYHAVKEKLSKVKPDFLKNVYEQQKMSQILREAGIKNILNTTIDNTLLLLFDLNNFNFDKPKTNIIEFKRK